MTDERMTIEELQAELEKAQQEEQERLRAEREEQERQARLKVTQDRHALLRPIVDSIVAALKSSFIAEDGWTISVPTFEIREDGSGTYEGRIGIRNDLPHVYAYAGIMVQPDSVESYRYGPRKRTGKARVKIQGILDTKVYRPKTWTDGYTQKVLDHVSTLHQVKASADHALATKAVIQSTEDQLKATLDAAGLGEGWKNYGGRADGYFGHQELPPLPRPDGEVRSTRKLVNHWKVEPSYDHVDLHLNIELALDQPGQTAVLVKLIQASQEGRLTDLDALDRLLADD